MLTSDDLEITHCTVENLGIFLSFSNAHVDNDLIKSRNLVNVLVTELLRHSFLDLAIVKIL